MYSQVKSHPNYFNRMQFCVYVISDSDFRFEGFTFGPIELKGTNNKIRYIDLWLYKAISGLGWTDFANH